MNEYLRKDSTTTGTEHTKEQPEKDKKADIMHTEKNTSAETGIEIEDEGRELEKMKDDLDAARRETAENYDRLLRTTAEFENFRKRTQRQMDEYRKFANESLLRELLTVVDNLERAIRAAEENHPEEEEQIIEGVRMTLNEILGIFKRYNVTPIEAHGRPFDPAYHEAVMQTESDEHPENTVINEFQKGYLLHDRLLRPAMVVVSRGSSLEDSKASE